MLPLKFPDPLLTPKNRVGLKCTFFGSSQEITYGPPGANIDIEIQLAPIKLEMDINILYIEY